MDIDGLCSKIQIGIPDDELSGKITSLARDIITCIVDINYELDLIDIIIRDKEEYTFVSIEYVGRSNEKVNDSYFLDLGMMKKICG